MTMFLGSYIALIVVMNDYVVYINLVYFIRFSNVNGIAGNNSHTSWFWANLMVMTGSKMEAFGINW